LVERCRAQGGLKKTAAHQAFGRENRIQNNFKNWLCPIVQSAFFRIQLHDKTVYV
jgi:hypothetical protein